MKTDFAFYSGLYGGTLIPEKDFARYASFAASYIRSMTIAAIPDDPDYKMAICHVAEIFYRSDSRGNISSENNDGYSVVYDKASDPYRVAGEVAAVYLSGKGVLYRGIG